jgi:hypothetical protein
MVRICVAYSSLQKVLHCCICALDFEAQKYVVGGGSADAVEETGGKDEVGLIRVREVFGLRVFG